MTTSRWAEWTTVSKKGLSLGDFLKEAPEAPIQGGQPVQTGNPTGTGAQSPSQKAKEAGLQSDGHGGWIDSNSGQVVARTVQGELVWYDPGPGGGVVSDGEGGQQLTQAAPSWTDPVTGQLKVAPAQPESPEEIAAIPDSVPAQAPVGYDAWTTMTTRQMYAADKAVMDEEEKLAEMQQEVDAVYQSNEGMMALQNKFMETIEKGQNSGSQYKEAIVAFVQDKMNENAEQYLQYFETVPEEKHPELIKHILKHALRESQKEYYDDNVKPDWDKAFEQGDDQLMDKLNKLNTSEHEFAQKDIDNMMDDAKGIKSVDVNKYKGGTYTGKNVIYNVGGDIFIPDGSESNNHDEDKEYEVLKAGDKVAREYNTKDPTKIMEVEWDATKDEDDGEFNRKAALDAMYTWRKEVLPELPEGLIVANKPAAGGSDGNVRERIYQMAGFTPTLEDYGDYQFGIVVIDEKGVKRVVPVDPSGKTMKESMSSYNLTDMLIENINLNDHVNYNTIYEGLFL